jgi:hypothetical protein
MAVMGRPDEPRGNELGDPKLPPPPPPPPVEEPYFVRIDETLVGRRAGGSAAEKAREMRKADPLGTFAARVLRGKTDERAWRKGAHGEAFVGWLLKRLPEGWHLFNDIPVGDRGANIDHLLVCPAGVFTVNTKNLTGTVWLAPRTLLHNGHRTDFLPSAAAEARRAARLLTAALGRPVIVRPVLAIIADDWDIKEKPTDVVVGSPRWVKQWLLEQPVALSSREVVDIAGAATKPSTWTARAQANHRPASAKAPGRSDMRPGDPCPCGGEVVVRARRSDGAQFLGCSRFPACRRNWPLPP